MKVNNHDWNCVSQLPPKLKQKLPVATEACLFTRATEPACFAWWPRSFHQTWVTDLNSEYLMSVLLVELVVLVQAHL